MGKQKTNETKIATLWGEKKSVAKTSARPTKKRETAVSKISKEGTSLQTLTKIKSRKTTSCRQIKAIR